MKTNNELLAEFMGLVESTIPNRYWTEKSLEGFGMGKLKELNYDTDWNRLMLVVDKIESVKIDKLYFNIQINKDKVSLFYTHISDPTKQIEMFFEWGQENKIANTYKIVVEFVKWYNEQKK
jgi:hypothetical protein